MISVLDSDLLGHLGLLFRLRRRRAPSPPKPRSSFTARGAESPKCRKGASQDADSDALCASEVQSLPLQYSADWRCNCARYGGKIGNTPIIWALKALLVSKRDDNAVTKGIQGIILVGFLVSRRKGSMVPSSVEGKA